MTTRLEMPVASSASSRTEMPSTRSSNRTRPATSVMIGVVYGSHSAKRVPRLIAAPSFTFRRAP